MNEQTLITTPYTMTILFSGFIDYQINDAVENGDFDFHIPFELFCFLVDIQMQMENVWLNEREVRQAMWDLLTPDEKMDAEDAAFGKFL